MPQLAADKKYKRILLKLSGEALTGSESFGIDPKILDSMALAIGQLVGIGVQVGLVVGGGNLFRELKAACPAGIDVYFDNVGGPTLDAALENMAALGRIAICGRISQTAAAELYGVKNMGLAIGKRLRVQGFIVSDYNARYTEARAWLAGELKAGRLQQRLHILDGLEHAPSGLRMLFEGGNTGKLAIRVAN